VARLRSLGDLVVQDCGFNLHAKTHAGALDDDARARLLRYVLRPPLSQERLTVLPDHRVRLTLKRPWSDGTYALDMDALALLARLASAVPPPKQHQTIYSGVLAAGGPLASADHSARARRPISKCRPSATAAATERPSSTGVHQGRQAAAFWQPVSYIDGPSFCASRSG